VEAQVEEYGMLVVEKKEGDQLEERDELPKMTMRSWGEVQVRARAYIGFDHLDDPEVGPEVEHDWMRV
jgi:hypothetical protein